MSDISGATINKRDGTTVNVNYKDAQARADCSDLKSAINSLYDIELGSNLVDSSTGTTGAIQSDGTISSQESYSNYTTYGFVELKPNTTYVFSAYRSSDSTPQGYRKYLLLYDENKDPVSASYQNTTTKLNTTFASGSTYKYARMATETGTLPLIAEGSTTPDYSAYSKTELLKIELGETPVGQVNGILEEKACLLYPVKNLVNEDAVVQGFITNDGTITKASAYQYYSTSDFIEVEPSTDYILGSFNASTYAVTSGRKAVLEFNANKEAITATYQNEASDGIAFETTANTKFVRVSFDTSELCQLEQGEELTNYVAFELGMNNKLGSVPSEQVANIGGNVLYGKKWSVCGDSFTNGATDTLITEGVYKGQHYVYPYLIGNRNNMLIEKFFAGGRTLAYPSDGTFDNSLTDPSMPFYYQNIPSDSDYITIYLGINDSHHKDGIEGEAEIPLGTITDNTTATYYGAWNVVLSWLIENRPFAHIGIIVSNACDTADYRTAQLAIAEKYGIPYIDMNGDSRTPVMVLSQNPSIASSVKDIVNEKQAVDFGTNNHPNDDTHLYESYFIENFLRSI